MANRSATYGRNPWSQDIHHNHILVNESIDSEDTLLESVNVESVCYLCIGCGDGRSGSTLYDTNNRTVHVVQEVEDNDFELVHSLLIQTQPNHVIVSSKCDPKLIQLLTTYTNRSDVEMTSEDESSASRMHSRDESMETETIEGSAVDASQISQTLLQKSFHFTLHTVSHKLFDFENSKTRILSMDVKNISNVEFADEMQKFVFISSLIDFWDNNTFRSFGALLRFLDTNCAQMQTQDIGSSVEITRISRLYLDHMVAIDRNTFESLHIFQHEWHPSAAKQGLNQKEGLSLYGLFNCCVSKVGANYLRKIFLHPTQDIDVIMDRLNSIEFFVDPINGSVKDNLNQHLKNIKGVNALFNRLMTESFSVKDIKILCDNLLNAMRIRDIIVGQNSYLKIFQQIYDSFTDEMQYLANMITKIVDLNKSLRTETFEIHYGIDVELDFAKDLYSQLSPILNKVAESETNTYGHFLRDIHCLYIPQIGFLTSAEHFASESESSSHSDDLQVVVTAGQRIYYKTFTTIELDQHFGDIHSEIIDRQILIINRLQQYIANYRHLFNTIEKYCAKLDALIAMSQIAVNYRYCKPNITTDGVIEIRDGRHPLIELMSKTFVPNDYYSGGQHKTVKIISGPNACGKSVYLKQICLIVFMAHIGSYVPALSANIPIVDRIFTRLHTPESMSMRLSTFMLDLNQMSNASKYTTKRSLVVVDEFGKGTQSVDGLALMAACLNQWLAAETPHLMVSTHFRCLLSLLYDNHLYDCQTFQFTRDERQTTYLFKLIDGLFEGSIASHIAYLASIPMPTIERGLQLCEQMSLNNPIKPKYSSETQSKFDTYEEIANKFIELNLRSQQQIQHFFSNEFFKQFPN